MKIEVKQTHIDDGIKEDPNHCMVALAIKDVTNEPVWVDTIWAYVGQNMIDCRVFDLPNNVCELIEDFDKGEHVEPFEFEMKEISND